MMFENDSLIYMGTGIHRFWLVFMDEGKIMKKSYSRDRDSRFYYRIIWDNWSKTGAWRDKLNKFYLLVLFNYKY